jgi:hypothetical protein
MAGQVPEKFQCGFATKSGTSCRAAKLKDQQNCRKHTPQARFEAAVGESVPVPKMSLEGVTELFEHIADTINRTRSGELPTKQGATLAALYREALKALVAKEKLDPAKVLEREFSAETGRQIAQSMSIEKAREIATGRHRGTIATAFAEIAEKEPMKLLLTLEAANDSDKD